MVDNTNIKRLVTDSVLCHTGAGRSVETVRQGRSVALLRCLLLWLVALTVFSCRDGYEVVPSTTEKPGGVITSTSVVGMYLLNEGNMGSNKCTLDYLDLSGTTATYLRNIYAERNPTVVKELGDVGNDIKVYGGWRTSGTEKHGLLRNYGEREMNDEDQSYETLTSMRSS